MTYRIEKTSDGRYVVRRRRLWGLFWERYTYYLVFGAYREYDYETPDEAEAEFLSRLEKKPGNKIIKTVVKKENKP